MSPIALSSFRIWKAMSSTWQERPAHQHSPRQVFYHWAPSLGAGLGVYVVRIQIRKRCSFVVSIALLSDYPVHVHARCSIMINAVPMHYAHIIPCLVLEADFIFQAENPPPIHLFLILSKKSTFRISRLLGLYRSTLSVQGRTHSSFPSGLDGVSRVPESIVVPTCWRRTFGNGHRNQARFRILL